MAGKFDVWVFSEKADLLAELIGGARALADKGRGDVVALVRGPRSDAERAAAQGAGRVIWFGEPEPGSLVDDIVPSLTRLAEEHRPAVILIGSTKRGKAVAGRLAARLDVSALADVLEFLDDNGALKARHMIFGGGAVRVDRSGGESVVATVGPAVFTALPVDTTRRAEIEEAEWIEPDWRVRLRETRTRAVSRVNLGAARKVVCPGRGVAKQEDLAMIDELAQVMGAEVACTRPLAEGLDWLPRERYIGISGAHIKPDLYLGVGVSGQVQHMVGMSSSRVVVAINKDENAPIFSQSDYGIVGDLYEVVPALIQALKERK